MKKNLYKKNKLATKLERIVGEEISSLRKDKGLTGSQLAKMIGVSQQQISRYECGTCKITFSSLLIILQCLNVHVLHFFNRVYVRMEKERNESYEQLVNLINIKHQTEYDLL